MKYKIWWQSSTVLDPESDYAKSIENHSTKILNPDFELEVHGVNRGTSELHYMFFEFLNIRSVIGNVIKAEEEGYDAVALGCFTDPGLHEAREVVNIPVLGMAESSMLFACMYGRKFSIVTYLPQVTRKRFDQLTRQYGLESRAAPMSWFEISLEMLSKSFKDPEPVIKQFVKAALESIKHGAEVILPGCGLLNMILVENGIKEIEGTGVSVLDVSGALMKLAEAMIVLNRISGTKVSRYGYYESPPKEMITEVKKIYGFPEF
jgi:Asp/Glu/hydantoin racemase